LMVAAIMPEADFILARHELCPRIALTYSTGSQPARPFPASNTRELKKNHANGVSRDKRAKKPMAVKWETRARRAWSQTAWRGHRSGLTLCFIPFLYFMLS